MQEGNLNEVWEIKVLKRKPNKEDAQKMLERIAKQVEPIMRNHKWRVKVLSEIHPKNGRLLGLNVGAGVEVKLSLRKPNRELEFFAYEEVLDTMLHELCHNAHSAHNASFYRLWDELRKECEELISKGITGTGVGFDLPGRKLGGFSRQPPLSSLRKTSLAAAQNRQKLNSLLPSGPLHLGGDKSIMTALSPIQAAAMAAERRLRDEIWCASSSNGVNAEGESDCDILETVSVVRPSASGSSSSSGNACSAATTSRKRGNVSSGASFVDLTSDDNSTSTIVHDGGLSKRSRDHCSSSTPSTAGCSQPNNVNSSKSFSKSGLLKNHLAADDFKESVMWTCEMCTLMNPPLALLCEACQTLKPKDVSEKYKLWSCKFCTMENTTSLDKCSACDQWRYSHGPPLSARPLNLGT